MRREKKIPRANNPLTAAAETRVVPYLFMMVVVVTGRSGNCLLLCRCGPGTTKSGRPMTIILLLHNIHIII